MNRSLRRLQDKNSQVDEETVLGCCKVEFAFGLELIWVFHFDRLDHTRSSVPMVTRIHGWDRSVGYHIFQPRHQVHNIGPHTKGEGLSSCGSASSDQRHMSLNSRPSETMNSTHHQPHNSRVQCKTLPVDIRDQHIASSRSKLSGAAVLPPHSSPYMLTTQSTLSTAQLGCRSASSRLPAESSSLYSDNNPLLQCQFQSDRHTSLSDCPLH